MKNDAFRVRLVPAVAAKDGIAPLVPSGPGRETDPIPEVCYAPGQSVAQAVYLSGLFLPPALCSGMARCGRCRMRLIPPEGNPLPQPGPADRERFTPRELDAGMRLTCRLFPLPGLVAELPPGTQPFFGPEPGLPESAVQAPPDHGSVRASGSATGSRNSGTPFLAVDLGTTSLQWRLLAARPERENSEAPAVLWEGAMVNPQMGAGSDVVSRIAASLRPGGRERLRDITQKALRSLCAEADRLARSAGHWGGPERVCLAANSAMTAIALGLDAGGLAAAPLSLPCRGGAFAPVPGLPPVWIPPLLSPFVGGDISAGYASLAFATEAPRYPFLLADMGTNGEFLLALSPDRALAASVALGPALEGIGLRHGTEARPGAVNDVHAAPAGLTLAVLPGAPADDGVAGITGSGYLALLDTLLRFGGMDRDGHFLPGKRLFPVEHGTDGGEERIALPLGLALYASDVEETLKVKAAFSMGLGRLLETAGIAPGGLYRVYLAGALGCHARTRALENLGFFPPGMRGRISPVGNSSLAGASLLARSAEARNDLVRWAASVQTLDLAADPAFVEGFASRMRFCW